MDANNIKISLINGALTLAGLISLVAGVVFLLQGQAPYAAAAFTPAVLMLFAATIERFESIKGLGLEAKTRKLDESIDKAEVAADRLRRLAEIAGKNLVMLASPKPPIEGKKLVPGSYELVTQVRTILKDVGSSDQAIKEALSPWAREAVNLAFQQTLGKLNGRLSDERQRQQDAPENANLGKMEGRALAEELKKYEAYTWAETIGHYSWPLTQFPGTLMKLLDGATLISAEERNELRPTFLEAEAEIKAICDSMDIDNAEFWKDLFTPPVPSSD